ncbi:MAG: hypothetical protein WAO08_19195, partial [Hyphomicrobiaceae bacterium]
GKDVTGSISVRQILVGNRRMLRGRHRGAEAVPALAAADLGMAMGRGYRCCHRAARHPPHRRRHRPGAPAVRRHHGQYARTSFSPFFTRPPGDRLAVGLFSPVLGLRLSPML